MIEPAGRVLLTHHRRLDLWVQLGGHADGERSAPAVALREAREESSLEDLGFHPALRLAGGLPALLDVDVHPIPGRPGEPAHEHHDLRFLLVTTTPERALRAAHESHALEWLSIEEARRRGDPGLGRALAKIARLAAPA